METDSEIYSRYRTNGTDVVPLAKCRIDLGDVIKAMLIGETDRVRRHEAGQSPRNSPGSQPEDQ